MSRRPAGHELKSFGIHLVAASLAFALALSLAVGAMMLVRWALPLELASSSSQKALQASGRILELHERFWPVVLVSLVGVAVAAGWLARRITGPLVRFTHVFARIGAGEVPEPIQIRGSDYLVNEVEALNAMLGALQARAADRARLRGELLATLEELGEQAAEKRDEAVAALAGRALELTKALDGSAA